MVDGGERGRDHGASPITESGMATTEKSSIASACLVASDIAWPVGDDPTDGDVELTSAAFESDHLDPIGAVTSVEKRADRHTEVTDRHAVKIRPLASAPRPHPATSGRSHLRDLLPAGVGAGHRLLGEIGGHLTIACHCQPQGHQTRKLRAEHGLEVHAQRHPHIMQNEPAPKQVYRSVVRGCGTYERGGNWFEVSQRVG